MALGITRRYLKTKFKEDIKKCDCLHLKGGVILLNEGTIDVEENSPQIETDTFIGKNPILIWHGHKSIIR